jgi:CRP/FNR family transcriptional regulator, putaive post-exponential-phase nitrogen-starvation regulator
MEIYKGEKKKLYIEKHSIAHQFSFSVDEFIEVREYQRDEWIIQEGMRPDFFYFM